MTCGPSGADAGPTWGGVCAHSVHRAVQRRQPALHAADALGEAGLLALQHLLQLADGREELLLVQTVLRGERVTSTTAVGASVPHAHSQLPEATQAPGPPMPPRLTERLHKAPRQLALSQVTRRRAPAHRTQRQLASRQKQSSCSEPRAELMILNDRGVERSVQPKGP